MQLGAILTAVLLAASTAICEQERGGGPDLEMCEVVFRYQFQHLRSDATAHFLKIMGHDPSPDLLKRLADTWPPVRKASDFRVGSGILFEITKFQRINKGAAIVTAWHYTGPHSGAEQKFWMSFKDGNWVISKVEDGWRV